ncbi:MULTISPECIES: ribonuclease E inhibitor RraB [unclassified Gilliamella]|uniref:ribonuclease E inhibitor RraB n=1 Tax=unclassified Gilliamella TaxID=2685620 RepID=UPI002269EE8F|nr:MULTISPECIES: ribonuclease E inhibitor RraB [unclassified Gilliamella]MCX8573400.1 ribonuclease E inhibitor RraB [Gilliamella sp. B3831]MCX8575972.1 ribonuclease E inhibitor RraB [Gilliamella sp. B3815]MCX8579062.1 ribonuclease E inhibitor RraB [Gilliamella sp. B2717]MCX8588202.1 ribonuclease E inhibitor RraB [Gilliamella sp. B3801]MCX8589480.1 ribonuclease E inhibitor RraB [Gilliamella sp. B3812]
MKDQILLAQQDTQSIIDELLEDGSDPHALYLIEHHISSENFDKLEKVAVEAYKLGYEATDPDEDVDDSGNVIIGFDIIAESPLSADLINAQIAQIMTLAHQFNVNYDGWGTYFEDGSDDILDDSVFDNETLH